MRRFIALMLFVVGYWMIATLDPAVAALPAFAAFCGAGTALSRRPEPVTA